MNILVTGAAGYLGQTTCSKLAGSHNVQAIYGADIKPATKKLKNLANYHHLQCDIRSSELQQLIKDKNIDVVCHLASMINPPPGMSAEEVESIEIDGLKNLLEGIKNSNTQKIIFTSSGAAYGYYAENPLPIPEDFRTKGNPEFPYSHHKANAEKLLNEFSASNPDKKVLTLRPGTILGSGMRGPIVDYFEKKVLIGVSGFDSPFCFVLDQDVAEAIVQGCLDADLKGAYNLSGDGYLPLKNLAKLMQTPFISLPKAVMTTAISTLRTLRLTQYSPCQVNFMCYRPVLANDRLKKDFNNLPSKTSEEVFNTYLSSRSES